MFMLLMSLLDATGNFLGRSRRGTFLARSRQGNFIARSREANARD